jgi:hypothetical protein
MRIQGYHGTSQMDCFFCKLNPSRIIESVEYKYQNISAILIDLGLPYIRGYKPAFNYQGLLADIVGAQVDSRQLQLLESAERLMHDAPERRPETEWDKVFEARPVLEGLSTSLQVREHVPRYYNYAAREGHNKRLGQCGEEFVLHLEKRRLASIGRVDLVDEVEWTSKKRGDGAGYDIRSFKGDTDRELFIEVKTTNSGKYQPFIISGNEVAFSEEHREQYSLYRVFQFKNDPRVFTLDGCIREYVNTSIRQSSRERVYGHVWIEDGKCMNVCYTRRRYAFSP